MEILVYRALEQHSWSKWRVLLATALLAVVASPGAAQPATSAPPDRRPAPKPLALVNVTLVDPASEVHASGMTVLVGEKGRIRAVFPTGEQTLPPGAEVHDLEGRYVIPGLINSHFHLFRRFLESREAMYKELERMLLGGVVAIRDMAGDARVTAAARRDVLAGERVGPDIYTAAVFGGPEFMAGDPRNARASRGYLPGEAPWNQAVTLESDLPRAIARADGTQVSALKLYLGLEPELIGRLAEEAHRQGLQVWAHSTVYPSRPIEVVKAGVDGISHACGLAWQDADLDPSPYAGANVRQRPSFDPTLVEADSAEMAALFEEMVQRGVVLDPTLSVHLRPGDDRHGCTTELMVALTRAAHRNGVALSTGTDWGSPLDDPAPTVLHEIEALVDHEVLTPQEALTAATLHGARSLGLEQDYGTIEPGKLASLVVLGEDPTRDVRALRKVVAVIHRGKLHWRAESEGTAAEDEADTERKALVDLERQSHQWWLDGDTEALAELMLGDYRFVAPNGVVETRDYVTGVDPASERVLEVESLRMEPEEVMLRGNRAVVVGVIEMKATVFGRPAPGKLRVLSLFERASAESDWRLAARSTTPIRTPPVKD